MTKERSPLVAGLFNFISPGLGFLYVNKPLYAVVLPLGMVLLLASPSWTKILFSPTGMLIVVALEWLIWFSSIAAVVVVARRQPAATLSRCQRWYVYVGFIVVWATVWNVLTENRSQLLGSESFRFPSISMQDTLLVGDHFISDTWKYRSRGPQRGDVVVFRFSSDPKIKYAKRVIGLPGEQIELKGGVVKINGTVLSEPYVKAENNRRMSNVAASYKVPDDSYFVLGDNRDSSNDSRFLGFVPKENIYGRVEFIYFSFDPNIGIRADRIGKLVQ